MFVRSSMYTIIKEECGYEIIKDSVWIWKNRIVE